MKIARFIKAVLIVASLAVYAYSAVYINGGRVYNVSVEMGMPFSIVWPCEISVVGDNGEKGLRIPPKVGRGWLNEAGGEASYKFYVPQNGTYRIWAYSLWFDECANAVFARVDNLEKAIIGNDPVYGRWHWVRAFDVHLQEGTHTLLLSNHSDHIALQKVLFTSSRYVTPEQCGLVFSDIFYDGFDGCDHGNFAAWQIVTGKWLVQDPTQQICFVENALVGESEDHAFILYKGDDWSRYSLNMAVRPVSSKDPNAYMAICFGLKDKNQYHQLRWRHPAQADAVKMEIIRSTTGRSELLAAFQVPWEDETWHRIEIELDAGSLVVSVDKTGPVHVPVGYTISGGIGLRLEGKVTAYFDDVHVREIAESLM